MPVPEQQRRIRKLADDGLSPYKISADLASRGVALERIVRRRTANTGGVERVAQGVMRLIQDTPIYRFGQNITTIATSATTSTNPPASQSTVTHSPNA